MRISIRVKIALVMWLAVIVLSAIDAFSQSTTQISRRCSGASPSPARAEVEIEKDGDVTVNPCSGRSTIFTGAVNLTGATVTGVGTVSGSGTANYVPVWTSSSALGNTPLTWNGTSYTWQDSAGTATFTGLLTPSSAGAGRFQVGVSGSNQPRFNLNQSTSEIEMNANANSQLYMSNAAGGQFQITVAGFGFALSAANVRYLNRVATAAGTTGAQTINVPVGSVNFAAGTAALTVTSSITTATSLIIAVPQTNDATCSVKNVVPAAGSFVINMTANCTAETKVAFWVTN